MSRKRIEIPVGSRFGKLTVLGCEYDDNRCLVWRCLCDCGNETTAVANQLITGRKVSCGCFRKDAARLHKGREAWFAARREERERTRREEAERKAAERRRAEWAERQMRRNQKAGEKFNDWWMFGDHKQVARLRKMFK